MGRWVADFETTTNVEDCRIWLWAICDIDNPREIEVGYTGDSFLQSLLDLNGQVYFHNLAFDGRFLLDLIMRSGYQHSEKRDKQLKQHEFNTLISDKGKFYSIGLCTRSGSVSVRDSLKLLPMSVSRIAKSFGLPNDEQKGTIDYNASRPEGYTPTQDEISYVRNDVLIVARALKIEFDAGLDRMTAGSNAFHAFKSDFTNKEYLNLFPVVGEEVDSLIRKSYRGGFTYVSDQHKGCDVGPGCSYDYNSMYPSVMLDNYFPVGVPKGFEGRYKPNSEYPLHVQVFTCLFELKPEGIPMIQIQGSWAYKQHEYATKSEEPETIVLTSVDMKLFEDNYVVTVLSWDGGYMFRAVKGIFTRYINTWKNVKESTTGGKREIAKLMLNSLYGKFGTNPDVTQKIPKYVNGVVKFETGDEEKRLPVYVAVAAFVTAYARNVLIRAIMSNRDRFVYCDTDSLHLLGTEPASGIPVHDTEFSHWKHEGNFTRARHIRAKTYIWDLNGKTDVVCAGMPSNIKTLCNFDNFKIGFSNLDKNGNVIDGMGKLIPVNVVGGVVLAPRPYRLR